MTHNEKNRKEAMNRKQEETVKDKIHRHLNNKNDIITEDDIRDTMTDKKVPVKDAAEPKKKTE